MAEDGRRRFRWPSRWAWAQLVVALLVTAAVTMLWLARFQAGPLARLDGWAQDAQMQWRGPLKPGTSYPIALVRFDDASASRFGGDAPNRQQLAALIERIQAAGPRLIAVDMLLMDPHPDADGALAVAMGRGAPVLLPFALPSVAGPGPGSPPGITPGTSPSTTPGDADAAAQSGPPALLAHAFPRTEGVPRSALVPGHVEAPREPLLSAARSLGHVTARLDADGTLRQDLPALPFDGRVYPSLALRIAGDAMRQPWSEATLRWSRDIRWGSLRVPLDLLSQQGVNYYGPTGTFAAVSVGDLLDGRVPSEALHNRIVILGVSALSAGDHFKSPFDAGLPGMERLATGVDNILTGRTLTRPGWATLAELIALLTLPLLCCVLLARGRLWLGLILVALLTAGGLAAAQWAFEEEYLVLPLASPLLAIAAASLCALALRALAALTRRRAALRQLRISEERYALAARGANDGLWDWDIARDRLDVSLRWLTLMGREADRNEAEEGIARFTAPLEEGAAGLFRSDLDAHLQGRSHQFHHVLRFDQGGQPRALLARGVAMRRDGKPARMAGTLTDISTHDRLQVQVAHDALHDRLTGLPNRALFVELLAQRLATLTPGLPVGVVLLGLDDFREFSERHGPIACDAVLTECAQRLGRRTGRTVARLGADQFAILFDARLEPGGTLVDRVPEWALARIEEPFLFDAVASSDPAASGAARTGAHRLTACAGWVHGGQGAFSADGMLVAAESALARAKAAGPGHVHAFNPAEQRVEQSSRWIHDNIASALEAGEFELHYQPFVKLSDRSLLGFEALIRWRHPTRGMVMPADFIAAAEESGQIAEIGRWTLIEAALQLRRWRDIGFKGVIAVNVSGIQLERDAELLADARETLKALGDVPASQLTLEVTERVAMVHPQRGAETLQALARLGFKLALDDFGTGFSSLAHLHRFPFDTLKVDRGIVMRLGEGRDARESVRTIVGLAGALGKQTLAEGVEDEQQATLLEELGVQVAQGWLFAKALPADEAKRLIQTVPWKKQAKAD